jgi:3-mercaptopyruvate sulfurtransferase SseA
MDLGFQQVYNMEGGFTQWQKDKFPVQPFTQNHSPWVHTVMEGNTDTAQYIVTDLGKPELSESLSSLVSSLFSFRSK